MKLVKSLLVVALLAISSMSFAQQKFGVFSPQEVMVKMPEMDSVQTKLKDIQDGLIADMQATEKEYQTKLQEYQKNKDTYSAIMREQKEKDIQSLMARMQEFQQVAQTELAEQQQILLAPIQKKVVDAINKVGKDNGFTMILDKTQPLFVSETMVTDVTPLVMAELGIKAE